MSFGVPIFEKKFHIICPTHQFLAIISKFLLNYTNKALGGCLAYGGIHKINNLTRDSLNNLWPKNS